MGELQILNKLVGVGPVEARSEERLRGWEPAEHVSARSPPGRGENERERGSEGAGAGRARARNQRPTRPVSLRKREGRALLEAAVGEEQAMGSKIRRRVGAVSR